MSRKYISKQKKYSDSLLSNCYRGCSRERDFSEIYKIESDVWEDEPGEYKEHLLKYLEPQFIIHKAGMKFKSDF